MSRINELLLQYCPNGVEQRRIKDVFKRIKGTPITAGKMKEIQSENGEIKVFAGGRTVINAKEIDIPNANITRVPAVIVQSRGVIDVVYYESPFTFKNEMWAYTNNEKVTVKYLYYFLKNNIQYFRDSASGMGSLPQISLPTTEEFEIPVPPLEIQEEIVRILDMFTSLEAELEAELEARKSQYEHYRDSLLRFEGKEAEWKMLGELGEFTRGKRFVKTDIVTDGVPCIHYGEMYTHYKIWAKESKSFLEPELAARLRVAKKGDVIIVAAGETIEDIGQGVAWHGDEDVVIHDACFSFSHNMHPNYVSHFTQTDLFHSQIKRFISSGKISSINAAGLSKAKIPVPSMEEQIRIASILDKFHVLINDISVGIPAEIEARRKQYEYYRNKLLTFKQASNG